jgi:uncharacterized membrane protein
MTPPGHPDDEIVGYTGRIGPGGSFWLRPVRVRDRYRQGGGCCLGIVALLVLGIVAAWVLERVVARRGRPPVRALQSSAAADHGRTVVTVLLGKAWRPARPVVASRLRPRDGSARAHVIARS